MHTAITFFSAFSLYADYTPLIWNNYYYRLDHKLYYNHKYYICFNNTCKTNFMD